jgi:hypothetical protein
MAFLGSRRLRIDRLVPISFRYHNILIGGGSIFPTSAFRTPASKLEHPINLSAIMIDDVS